MDEFVPFQFNGEGAPSGGYTVKEVSILFAVWLARLRFDRPLLITHDGRILSAKSFRPGTLESFDLKKTNATWKDVS